MTNSKRRRKRNQKNSLLILLLLILAVILVTSFLYKRAHKKDNNTNNIATTSNNASNNADISNNSNETKNNKKEETKPSIVENLTAEEIEQSKKRGLPVLMYHFFYDEQAGETGKDANFMEVHAFEEQIKYLSENNYYVPTWDEVLGYIQGKNGLPLKSVVITIDDGDESFYKHAVPVLNKYNFKATSFLITSRYGGPVDTANYPNIDFQSHSNNMHEAGSDGKGAFLTISYEQGCKDLESCRKVIPNNCIVFCYPFGHFNDNCKKMLKDCNYTLAFTTQGGRVFPGDDPYELPRVRMSKGDTLNAFISKIK